MRSLIVLILLCFWWIEIFASYPFVGRCPRQSVIKNLNMTRYAGTWYEIEQYYSYADSGSSCTSLRYKAPTPRTRIDGKEYMEFLKRSMRKSRRRKRISTKLGKVIFTNTKKIGRLETIHRTASYGDVKKSRSSSEEPREAYWVLGTDYGNYSVVWSCENAGILNFQNVVFLARERDPSIFVRGRAYGVIQSHGLSTKILVSTDQEDCPNLFQPKNTGR